ncbi:MAG: four helix bundle protein [Bacteroidota bacterium]|nr:four helix bundle protein [Bacteroidota bacterium]
MERAAVSIPSNIAEGYELNSDRGFIRYLLISKGSAGELRTQLYIAIRRNYISSDSGKILMSRIKIETAMIQKFIIARRKRIATNIIKKTISVLLFWM